MQVQFDEWQDVKMCSILINDDSIYEGPETFYVELSSPTYALLGGVTTASVTIVDEEDGELQAASMSCTNLNHIGSFCQRLVIVPTKMVRCQAGRMSSSKLGHKGSYFKELS